MLFIGGITLVTLLLVWGSSPTRWHRSTTATFALLDSKAAAITALIDQSDAEILAAPIRGLSER